MGLSIDEILAQARRPERVVNLCLRGDLTSAFQALERRLPDAGRQPSNLGERAEASLIAEQMEDLRQRMSEAEVPFLLRALPPREWTARFLPLPQRGKDEDQDAFVDRFHAWVCRVVAASCVEPAVTVEQVDQLVPSLSNQQWSELSDAAWELNTGKVSIPFSAAASELTRGTAPTLRRPETSEPASPGS